MKRTVALFSFLALFSSPVAFGAACCGSSSAVPSLISGDDKFQLTFRSVYEAVVADVSPSGSALFRADGDHETVLTQQIDGAVLLSDRWQVGARVPVVTRSRTSGDLTASSTGLGDLAANVGFEILPEWSYSAWRPRGYLFLDSTFPTSPSVYNASAAWAVDARGRGFFSTGLGGLLLKTWGDWDVSLMAEGHRSFARQFSLPDNQGTITATPGWGILGSLGAGYAPGFLKSQWRLGASLAPSFEQAIRTQGVVSDTGSDQIVWTTVAQLSYFPSSEWTLSLSYADQTLFGPAQNVALNRGVSFLIQKRWER